MKRILNKRTYIKTGVLFLAILLFLFIFQLKEKNVVETKIYSEEYISVEEIKSELRFYNYTEEEWDQFFSVYHKDYLTGQMLKQVTEKLGVDAYVAVPSMGNSKIVTREEWNDVYRQILDFLDTNSLVTEEHLLVFHYEKEEQNVRLETNQGTVYTALPESLFHSWEAYHIYLLDGTCIGINGISEEKIVLDNVYVSKSEAKQLQFLFHGNRYELELGEEKDQSEIIQPGVCDLEFAGSQLKKIYCKQDFVQGNMLAYDEQSIEIEGYGRLEHAEKLPVYQTYGEVSEKQISDVVLGNMKVSYVTGNGMICAVILEQPADIQNIRVLLLGENGKKTREQIYLKADQEVILSIGTEESTIPAGTLIASDFIGADGQETMSVKPVLEQTKIFVCNPDGSAVSNGYSGSMEIRWQEDGFTLVNSVPFERYLCAVVPSEMPSYYEAEALKAQAVCARSYAYIQLMQAKLLKYGAHIDDSTSYQVYNKVPESIESVAAVEATRGQVMKYEGNVIEAFYFSTSMGRTDTAAVWNASKDAYGYLQSVSLDKEPVNLDLSAEADFKTYITSQYDGYDSNIKFYRWQVAADYTEKTDAVIEILKNRDSISDENVLYYDSEKKEELDSLSQAGQLQGILVAERSVAGAVLSLELQFEHACAIVKSEYNIRKVLGCGIQKVTFLDDSTNDSMTILPSSYFCIQKNGDGSYLLFGGGYGHGLGMSQNGANGLAKAGFSFEEILTYFYKEIELDIIGS